MKTLIQLLGHKRTWLLHILLPLILGFVSIKAVGWGISIYLDSLSPKPYSVAIAGEENGATLYKNLSFRQDIQSVAAPNADSVRAWVADGKTDVGIHLAVGFEDSLQGLSQATLLLYHRNNESEINRLLAVIEQVEQRLVQNRLDSLGLPRHSIHPIEVDMQATTSGSFSDIQTAIDNGLLYFLWFWMAWAWVIPCSISFSHRKKQDATPVSIWDKMLGCTLAAMIYMSMWLLGVWLCVSLAPPISFLRATLSNFLTVGHIVGCLVTFTFGQLWFVSILGWVSHWAKTGLGAWAISAWITLLYVIIIPSMAASITTSYPHWMSLILPNMGLPLVWENILAYSGLSFTTILLFMIANVCWGVLGMGILQKGWKSLG